MGGSGKAGSGGRTALVVVGAVLGAIAGVILVVVGVLAFERASETRDRAAALRRERAVLIARTRAVEGEADAPIDRAEKVATSVSAIVEAGDTVIANSATVSDVLSRAVDLANSGDLGAARRLYAGEGATTVQQLNADLARARAALARAQQAVAELTGP